MTPVLYLFQLYARAALDRARRRLRNTKPRLELRSPHNVSTFYHSMNRYVSTSGGGGGGGGGGWFQINQGCPPLCTDNLFLFVLFGALYTVFP